MRYLSLLSASRLIESSRFAGRALAVGLLAGTMSLATAQEDSKPGESDSSTEGKSSTTERDGDSPRSAGRGEGDRPFGGRGFGGDRPMGDRMRMMQPGGMMISPIVAALDTDRDGMLSATEIENASKSLLTLDKNGDGKLSNEELRPSMPPGMTPGGPGPQGPGGMNEEMMARMLKARDTDGDGKLTGDEIPPQMRERLAMMDTNGDEAIDMDEIKAAAQRMRQRMGQEGGQGRLQQQNRRDGEAVRPKRPAADQP
ncbi:MAG: hypothetical protein RLY14_1653 [Planctomycetota bacterium]|jgi:Ca2+-binding EF-hand superfamily protein